MRLYLLHLGLLQPPNNASQRSMRAYLFQSDAGENILIDTGLPDKFYTDPHGALAELPHGVDPVDFGPETSLPGQLSLIGLRPEDIDTVVLTHSDLDHIGGIDYLPVDIPVHVNRLERAEAVPAPSNPGWFSHWPDRKYVLLEPEDQQFRPGLTLLSTPGHTPGHFSVRVDLPNTGTILLAADAQKMADEAPAGTDLDQASASVSRLRALAAETGALFVLGHDGPQWHSLRHAPHYYD